MSGKIRGDLYHNGMGPLGSGGVTGGQAKFNYKGEPGRTHHSVYGADRHFSWDSYPSGDPRNNKPGPDIHGHTHKPYKPW